MMDTRLYTEALASISTPDWLAGKRQTALDRFLATGLPDARQEAWKYTPLDALRQARLHPPAFGAHDTTCPDMGAYPGHVLAFHNAQSTCHGTYLARQLAGSLRQLADTQLVHQYLGRVAGDGALANLNLALWQDGVRVHVPAGEQLRVPVFVIHAANEADAMLHPRALVVLEAGGEAVLVEHHLGETDRAYWHNGVTEVVLEAGARLTHVIVVEDGAAATLTRLSAVRLGRNSEYRALHIGLGGLLVRHDMAVWLDGAGATARIDAFDLADGRRHTDLHLRLRHGTANTTSRITYRGMADGRGRAVFDGQVIVEPSANQTDARQSCRGLLLSANAEIDATPRLEIHADDVTCGHGASIGNLDPGAMFYLRSRGIDPATARQLLLRGFAGEALGLLDETRLQDWLMPRLLSALSRQAGKESLA